MFALRELHFTRLSLLQVAKRQRKTKKDKERLRKTEKDRERQRKTKKDKERQKTKRQNVCSERVSLHKAVLATGCK